MTPSDNECIVSARLPPSKYLVRFRNTELLSALPKITHEFRPSCAGDMAPPSHQREADGFVNRLALLDSDTAGDLSDQNERVASYIEDEGGISHPWVKVSRWEGRKEKGMVQMCLTVQEPSIMERESVGAELPLSAQDGEL
jgi:hypothetical protein